LGGGIPECGVNMFKEKHLLLVIVIVFSSFHTHKQEKEYRKDDVETLFFSIPSMR
jgi:hypothetical protein